MKEENEIMEINLKPQKPLMPGFLGQFFVFYYFLLSNSFGQNLKSSGK